MKRVFFGVATALCIAQSVLAGPFYDPIGGGATTFGAGMTYSSGFGRPVFTTDIWADTNKCLRVTFAALSNDVSAVLICQGNLIEASNTMGSITLDMVNSLKGFCALVVSILDSETGPVVDDFDVIVQQENSGHAICP